MPNEETLLHYLIREKSLNNLFKRYTDGHSFSPMITAVFINGSDEFVIVVENCSKKENMQQVKRMITGEMKAKFEGLSFKIVFPHA